MHLDDCRPAEVAWEELNAAGSSAEFDQKLAEFPSFNFAGADPALFNHRAKLVAQLLRPTAVRKNGRMGNSA